MVYDDNGNLLPVNFLEYLVPTAEEAPHVETASLVTPSPHDSIGVKGIGEAGTIASSKAYMNAVIDTLAPYGGSDLGMPAMPEKIWRALPAGSGAAATSRGPSS